MSKYDTYLKEIRMTSADAAKVLGLDSTADAAAVKLAYRKASMQNHPDRGGSTEAMQNVNSAYDILKGGFKGTAVNSREEYAARQAAYEQAGAQILAWFERAFKPEAFQAYFKELFGQDFTATQKKKREYPLHSYADIHWNFQSQDGEVWFEVRYYASTTTYYYERSKMLSGNPDATPIAFHVSVNFMTNNRKQKIATRDYSTKTDYALFQTPELVFPRAKVKKGAANKTSKFSRRHFETALKAKSPVPFSQNKDHYFFTLSNNVELTMWRSTFFGTAAYSFLDARDKTAKARIRLKGTFPETEKALIGLLDLLKQLDKAPVSQIAQIVEMAIPHLEK